MPASRENVPAWRRHATDLAVFSLLAISVELFILGNPLGSPGFHPHPYWIAIVPMAALRGLVPGLLAVGLASVLYAGGLLWRLDPINLSALVTLANFLDPVLWIMATYVIGEARDAWVGKHRELSQRVREQDAELTSLRGERNVLAEANKVLKRSIVEQTSNFLRLITTAKRLEQADIEELCQIALEMLAEQVSATRATAYLVLPEGTIDLRRSVGWADEELVDVRTRAAASESVQIALREGRLVNTFHPEDPDPGEGPLLVGPLFDARGVLRALLCVEEIPPSRLTPSTVNTFQSIVRWAQASWIRGEKDASAPGGQPEVASLDETPPYLGNRVALGRDLRIEFERNTRFGGEVSLVSIHAIGIEKPHREVLLSLQRNLLRVVISNVRDIDTLYDFGYPGCYLLLLPQTDGKGAATVVERLQGIFSGDGELASHGPFSLTVHAPDDDAPDATSLLLRIAKSFREASALSLNPDCTVPVPDLYPAGDSRSFIHRMQVELGLALRLGHQTHILSISSESDRPDDDRLLARHLRDLSTTCLRRTDTVYALASNHCAVLLPHTNAADADVVTGRLVTLLRERHPDAPYGDLSIAKLDLAAQLQAASELVESCELRLPDLEEP